MTGPSNEQLLETLRRMKGLTDQRIKMFQEIDADIVKGLAAAEAKPGTLDSFKIKLKALKLRFKIATA